MTGAQIKSAVENLFTIVRARSTAVELHFICPEPGCGDSTGNRSVNLKTGKTNCWRCNHGGDFAAWMHRLGFDIEDDGTVDSAVPLEELDLTLPMNEQNVLPIVADVKLPVGFTYCADKPKSVYTRLIAEMAVRKNLDIEDFYDADVGFTKVDPKWEPFAIFPVIEYGHPVYWQGRTYCDVPGQTTKRFPSNGEVRYGAKYWIYNIDQLRNEKAPVALVVESILNVLSLRRFMLENGLTGVVPVCVFKHYLSGPQFKKLAQMTFLKEVCLLYDHDATKSSWDKSPLISNRLTITVAEMPVGLGGKKNDPNDDVATAWTAFENRQQSNLFTSVQYKLREGLNEVRQEKKEQLPAMPVGSPIDNLDL